MLTERLSAEPTTVAITLSMVLLLILLSDRFSHNIKSTEAELPIANRAFYFEPRVFAKFRWAFNARDILDRAYEKFNGRVYRVDRGDIELIVVPAEFIPELNLLPESVLSSRMAHSYNLLGHLNGIEIVKTSSLYFKTIMNKVTPALPKLTTSLKVRIGQEIESTFPQDSEQWITIEPLQNIVHCISSAFSLIAVGAPLSGDPEHIRLMSEQSTLVFTIVVIMRLVPSMLQPFLVWLLPAKWRLEKNVKKLQSFIVPEAQRLLGQKELPTEANLLSWMIQGARNDVERDPKILARLQAVTAGGGTHTVGMFVDNALYDFVTHPKLLEEVRKEMREKHNENDGLWDHDTYESLFKLDSALKESARVGPPTMTVYNRLMQSDYTLSNGITLRKGQMICVSGCSIQGDPNVFRDPETYHGLRAYNQSLEDHKAHPFKLADSELVWGAGRWACPGRFLANLEAKIIMVKLLNEYDFQLPPGKTRPRRITFHDFGFIGEHETLMARRRKGSLDLGY